MEWTKSSLSLGNGNCVQVAWTKSSASGTQGQCVEVASSAEEAVLVRNSRHPDEAVLRFTPGEWDAFLQGVHNGEFDKYAESSGPKMSGSVPMLPSLT